MLFLDTTAGQNTQISRARRVIFILYTLLIILHYGRTRIRFPWPVFICRLNDNRCILHVFIKRPRRPFRKTVCGKVCGSPETMNTSTAGSRTKRTWRHKRRPARKGPRATHRRSRRISFPRTVYVLFGAVYRSPRAFGRV